MTKKSRATDQELEPLVLLEDEPVENWEQDELGLLDFSRLIAAAALGTRGPFTIGVYGAWGEGKTSVLKQAQTLLDRESGNRDNIVTVWFNAWQFEHEEHPIVPLVASMVDQIEKTLNERKSLAQTDREAVGKALTKMRDALRSVAYGFSYAGFSAKDMIDRYEQLRKSGHPVLDRSLYYNAYEVLANAIPSELRKGDINKMPRIVVFIDDLDRCLPAKALRLLESIKLVLTQPGFIFTLAVYEPVIHQFINAEFKRQLDTEEHIRSGPRYLDKIVQLPLALPNHQSRFADYIKKLLQRRAVFQLAQNKSLCEIIVEFTGVLVDGVNHNPRSFVRLVNNLIVSRTLYLGKNPEAKDDTSLFGLFIVSHILRDQLPPDQFELLVSTQDICDRILNANDATWLLYEYEEDDEPPGSPAPKFRRHRDEVGDRLYRSLEQAGHLFRLLKSDPGKRWLGDEELRTQVTHFLAVTRQTATEPEGESAPQSQEEIIDDAIRRSLELKENTPITNEHRPQVTAIKLGGMQITDAGLKYVAVLKALTLLWLNGTQVTDSGLEHLAGLTALTKLSLTDTMVTDAGLEHLAGLTLLKHLSLVGTHVTDVGLKHLAGLTSLRNLWLEGTQVTDAGVEQFKNALPGCKIHR